MTEHSQPSLTSHHQDDLQLGDAGMDRIHKEFLDLHARLLQARGPEFSQRFTALLDHTREHFATEEADMAASGFPATAEHRADHQRLLGELERFARRIGAGSTVMAKAWISERLPEWFELHVLSMDSALAAHLKGR